MRKDKDCIQGTVVIGYRYRKETGENPVQAYPYCKRGRGTGKTARTIVRDDEKVFRGRSAARILTVNGRIRVPEGTRLSAGCLHGCVSGVGDRSYQSGSCKLCLFPRGADGAFFIFLSDAQDCGRNHSVPAAGTPARAGRRCQKAGSCPIPEPGSVT